MYLDKNIHGYVVNDLIKHIQNVYSCVLPESALMQQ